jgi:hypothetical protein
MHRPPSVSSYLLGDQDKVITMAEDYYCEGEGEVKVCKNYFVQRVLAMLQVPSPELLVKDAEQPRTGSLRRQGTVGEISYTGMREKAAEVLKCKELRNEELLPASSSPIILGLVGQSRLLMNRKARRFST